MQSSRAALRAQRVLRTRQPAIRYNVRFYAESAGPKAAGGGSGAVTGGLVGGGVALAIVYGWYHFSGAKTTVQTAQQVKGYADSAIGQFKVKFEENTPDTNQAIQTLRETANKYAAFVPGGKQYVDSAFNDLESIRKNHGKEVDQIVSDLYGELRDVSKKGSLDFETATQTWQVLSKHLERLANLAGDAAEDILNNHPQLKDKLGGSTDKLKEMGQRLGPEAKKQVDETWSQINDIVKAGVSAESIAKVKALVDEKTKKIKEMGEQAFQQGFEQIKPLLEKNPQVKKVVEDNMDSLKEGNVTEVYQKVKDAVTSGNTQDLEKYIQQAKGTAQQFSSDQLSKWLEMIPNGGQIIPQLQKLREVAEKHGEEAQSLVKETISEIKQVLDNKSQKAEKIAEQGKEDVKS